MVVGSALSQRRGGGQRNSHSRSRSNLLVRVESADVIHDFWVPQLGRKDGHDSRPSQFDLDSRRSPSANISARARSIAAPNTPGCGSTWKRKLPPNYERWLAQQRQPAPAPATADMEREGLRIFRDKTCMNCHTIKGVNPDIKRGTGPDSFCRRGRPLAPACWRTTRPAFGSGSPIRRR